MYLVEWLVGYIKVMQFCVNVVTTHTFGNEHRGVGEFSNIPPFVSKCASCDDSYTHLHDLLVVWGASVD